MSVTHTQKKDFSGREHARVLAVDGKDGRGRKFHTQSGCMDWVEILKSYSE